MTTPTTATTVTLTNPTDHELLALQVEGRDYHLNPGESLQTDDARVALLLAEAGFALSTQDREKALTADDHPLVQPTTGDETRFTGGRHHRVDDARANVPGTPVEVTGDTGALTNELAEELGGPDVPGVPVVDHEAPSRAARRRRGRVVQPEADDASVIEGTDLVVKTTPQALDAEDAPAGGPSDLAAAAAAAASTPASQATRDAVAAGAAATPPSDAPEEDDEDDEPGTPDLAWIDQLRGVKLVEAVKEQGLTADGKDADTMRAELRAAFSA